MLTTALNTLFFKFAYGLNKRLKVGHKQLG